MLRRLLAAERHLPKLFGERYAEFDSLLAFAREEQKSYGFQSDADFVCVRFERAVSTEVADFWLTLCVAFDFDNYLDDVLRK